MEQHNCCISAATNQIHITSKPFFRQSELLFFSPLLPFPFFLRLPLAMQDRATIMQPWQNPMHTWCRPIYTQVDAANWKAEGGILSNVCVVGAMSQPTASVERFSSCQLAALEWCWPLMIELHDVSCVSPRFIISIPVTFRVSGRIYIYHRHFFFLLLFFFAFFFFYASDYAALPTPAGNTCNW